MKSLLTMFLALVIVVGAFLGLIVTIKLIVKMLEIVIFGEYEYERCLKLKKEVKKLICLNSLTNSEDKLKWVEGQLEKEVELGIIKSKKRVNDRFIELCIIKDFKIIKVNGNKKREIKNV